MDPSILIIDDSHAVRQQILDILRKTSLFNSFHEAGSVIDGFKIALNNPVDVILCDLEMPGMDGFKFLNMVNTRGELRDIPVIMVTGREDQETKIKGLEQGASDYVTKPFDPAELVARIKVQLKIKTLQDSLKESNQALLELSNTDPLTRLSNRRCLMEALEREYKRSERSKSPLSLIMLDIDHFKKVNDSYGHQEGDVVLVALADMLRHHLREYDMAARFGGEEFALVLPDTDMPRAVQVAERLRESAGEMTFSGILRNLKLTISLGVACYPRGNRIKSVDDLIRLADYALYNAKGAGRDRVEVMEG
ncbi:diguanylate cyclase response regulator [Desulfuromonas versatilis]|uniref:diguanylate cyclase n=1 Tax=Desulfuromonas versatilis TaxID=2802975 RepID=A0ABN6E454_9BACT|nr:diguanylate cyclase [Desulfuromonas versatilis]BCR05936.1 diguanylate cyclase response regulator [Desulfuromonas versatilis]